MYSLEEIVRMNNKAAGVIEPESPIRVIRKDQPVERRLARAIRAVADYTWGTHLAGTPNEREAIGLIEEMRAALRLSNPPSTKGGGRG